MVQTSRNGLLVSAVSLLLLGLVALAGPGGPALDRFRTVDVVRLLAAGACFGVALVTVVSYSRGARRGGT